MGVLEPLRYRHAEVMLYAGLLHACKTWIVVRTTALLSPTASMSWISVLLETLGFCNYINSLVWFDEKGSYFQGFYFCKFQWRSYLDNVEIEKL